MFAWQPLPGGRIAGVRHTQNEEWSNTCAKRNRSSASSSLHAPPQHQTVAEPTAFDVTFVNS